MEEDTRSQLGDDDPSPGGTSFARRHLGEISFLIERNNRSYILLSLSLSLSLSSSRLIAYPFFFLFFFFSLSSLRSLVSRIIIRQSYLYYTIPRSFGKIFENLSVSIAIPIDERGTNCGEKRVYYYRHDRSSIVKIAKLGIRSSSISFVNRSEPDSRKRRGGGFVAQDPSTINPALSE